jgi:AraC family transcriptional regulator of adaptative response/methylated-DNA-[protein]-cysteine methyltransferase
MAFRLAIFGHHNWQHSEVRIWRETRPGVPYQGPEMPARGVEMSEKEQLEYVFSPSSVGTLLVAQSAKGLCAILIGSTKAPLIAELERRFSSATIGKGGAGLQRDAAKISRHIDSPRNKLDLPLDIRGTDFQNRVWGALRKIPTGKTASYSDIAKKIKAPKAVRAVAGACAANALSIIIPCHRVVRSDGSLSGYYWGVARKRKLLEIEGAK